MCACSVESDQAPMSLAFSMQEYWSGLPFPPSGDFPDPGIEPMSPVSPAWQAGSLPLHPLGSRKGLTHPHY